MLLVFAVPPARAETPNGEPLDLLVVEALQNNLELKSIEADIGVSIGEEAISQKWDNPELSLTPAIKHVPGSGGEPSDTGFKGTLEFGQLIEFPGKRSLRQSIAEKNTISAKIALEGFRNQLRVKVRKAFFELLGAQQITKLREVQTQTAKSFVDSARKRVEASVAPDFEAVRAEAELIASQKLLRSSKTAQTESSVELNHLIGRAPSLPLKVFGDIEQVRSFSVSPEGLEAALRANPALAAKRIELEKADLKIDAADLSRAPDFTVGPSIEYSDDERIYGVGISVPLPLWDQKSGEIQAATSERLKTRSEYEVLQKEIQGAVFAAEFKLQAAREQLALFTPAFRARLKAALNDAEKSYETSGTSVLLYLDAKRTYFDTQAEYLETLTDLSAAQAELEAAVGAPLTKN